MLTMLHFKTTII